ncbi:hypothetical protein GP486_000825 [Trichoglossum hirsutum]|uniref:Threonylcarbamoyl-AMP synthase n=1 Tax=Trichoglossum hirsutum TaxID=265104 RepID=A0A9P8LH33_9PEZI|nr:hypothetical protein GP486_000825 [Trichoglossum hirsutum]
MAHGGMSSNKDASTKDQISAGIHASPEADKEYLVIGHEDTSMSTREMAYEKTKQSLRSCLPREEAPVVPEFNSIVAREVNVTTSGHSEVPDHASELYEIQRRPPWATLPPKSAIILPVTLADIGHTKPCDVDEHHPSQDWTFQLRDDTVSAFYMREAARRVRTSNIPIAFPTETVYGLGADATRSEAVQGIFKAKQRPSDNPLIVHICSLSQLRTLLQPGYEINNIADTDNGHGEFKGDLPQESDSSIVHSSNLPDPHDPIPEIYKPLIQKFWPGPLTIILPNPSNSKLAPEVTAGLSTFGARMPRSPLALALIQMAGVPLAAPSANVSTKPSPTTAEHVKHDLEGRIDLILDGGPCDVGVESTVVDGLSDPPAILRPGGISMKQLQACPGWEDVFIGYKDTSEEGSKPKAPGMKYKHYSPKARVILHEAGSAPPSLSEIQGTVGVVRTRKWPAFFGLGIHTFTASSAGREADGISIPCCGKPLPTLLSNPTVSLRAGPNGLLSPYANGDACGTPGTLVDPVRLDKTPTACCITIKHDVSGDQITIWDIALGSKTEDIARGLFAALRELDSKGVDSIVVEGIEDDDDIAAAVMNRLRKAADVKIK